MARARSRCPSGLRRWYGERGGYAQEFAPAAESSRYSSGSDVVADRQAEAPTGYPRPRLLSPRRARSCGFAVALAARGAAVRRLGTSTSNSDLVVACGATAAVVVDQQAGHTRPASPPRDGTVPATSTASSAIIAARNPGSAIAVGFGPAPACRRRGGPEGENSPAARRALRRLRRPRAAGGREREIGFASALEFIWTRRLSWRELLHSGVSLPRSGRRGSLRCRVGRGRRGGGFVAVGDHRLSQLPVTGN